MLRRFSLVHLSLNVVVYAEGVNVAASHPLMSGSLAFGVGIFALKSIILILPRVHSPKDIYAMH